uniref:Tail protein n=1 Tax=Siphoviridae sp. ctY1p61 TaxID=2826373 RepID=A0A8S5NME1_9CAUD|nr:MAG TPA: tail protein [Siphoviridae sp. ctY1p61]
MKPILYASTEREFATNGIGILSDAASCVVTEERNGSYELEMQYPVMGLHYASITYRSLILAKPKPDGEPQPFRVYRITRPLGGLVTVYARHISYDLSGVVVPPFAATGVEGVFDAIQAKAVPQDSGFTFWSDKTSTSGVATTVPNSVRSLLGGIQGSILDVFGGEYEFDRFAVKLWRHRGEDRGVTIRYGKNLTALEQDANCASVYTAVYPYWTSEDVTVELPEKTVEAPGTYDFVRILPLDLTSVFKGQPTPDQLRTSAQYYIADNNVGVPRVSLSLSYAQLDGEKVDLCDTLTVTFVEMGVNTTAKVIKTTFDVLQDRYRSVEIGDMRASISETIAGQAETISSLPQTIQQAVLNATGWLTGDNGGYVIFRRNDAGQLVEQFISDSLDLQTAKNVWRWNLGGLGFSSSGVNGPYRLAITQDGRIVADFVTAGILTAITIQSMDGKSTWNLSTGEMDLYNTKITTSAQGSTFVTADYTEDDLAHLRNLILNQASPTLNDYEKLDVDGDGRFTAVDLLYVRQAIDGTQEIDFTTGWKFALDPTDGENLLKLTKTWHNNLTSESTEHLVLGAGFGNVRVNALSIGGDLISDYIVSHGVTGIWAYRKWASGVAECWLESELTLTGSTPVAYMNDSAYYSDAIFDSPLTFKTQPRGVANGALGTGLGFVNVVVWSDYSKIMVRVTGNQNDAAITIRSMIVTGRWK